MQTLTVFNIDLSSFIEGKNIESVEICDYHISGEPMAIFVGYYDTIDKLLVIKTTKNSAESAYNQTAILNIDCAIYYTI